MTLLIGALTMGVILSFLALGVFVSFRLFNYPDLTAEGSFALGGAVVAVLIISGFEPISATLIAFICGCLAGACTGFLRSYLKVQELLSGILVMTSLYSINLTIMGRSNIPLLSDTTIITFLERIADRLFGSSARVMLLGWTIPCRSLTVLLITLFLLIIFAVFLYLFFRTSMGTAMRAVGNNAQMIRALGVNTEFMVVLGIGLSNGCIALSGALLAQYQGFADVQMGIGMLVWGIASLIIGDSLIGMKSTGLTMAGAIMGSVLFRLLVSIALQWGMNPNHLKLVSAILVLAIIVLPHILHRQRKRKKVAEACSA
ncbi:MAG: ABC transporter permease [Vulcanimicrobiota bacterium]